MGNLQTEISKFDGLIEPKTLDQPTNYYFPTLSIAKNLQDLKTTIPAGVTLVAVSKTKPVSLIQEAYDAGQRVFGENKIQEMTSKWELLPKDIEWHMIGHVQSNKVKYMAPFVHMIHGVDSLKLLEEINKQAGKHKRTISCLLQIKIAKEDTKFGLSATEAEDLLAITGLKHVQIVGLMGMASYASEEVVADEFTYLSELFQRLNQTYPKLQVLSMGMSGDYTLAIAKGSNMVRIGSAIFGVRCLHDIIVAKDLWHLSKKATNYNLIPTFLNHIKFDLQTNQRSN